MYSLRSVRKKLIKNDTIYSLCVFREWLPKRSWIVSFDYEKRVFKHLFDWSDNSFDFLILSQIIISRLCLFLDRIRKLWIVSSISLNRANKGQLDWRILWLFPIWLRVSIYQNRFSNISFHFFRRSYIQIDSFQNSKNLQRFLRNFLFIEMRKIIFWVRRVI